MSVISRLQTLGAVLAVLAIAGAATPAIAKERYKPVREPFGWQQIDRNGDGDISKKEWNWAEKHGYDRLARNDRRHVTRKEYQAYFDQYRQYVAYQQARRQNDNDRYRQVRNDQPWWAQSQMNNLRRPESGGGYGRQD